MSRLNINHKSNIVTFNSNNINIDEFKINEKEHNMQLHKTYHLSYAQQNIVINIDIIYNGKIFPLLHKSLVFNNKNHQSFAIKQTKKQKPSKFTIKIKFTINQAKQEIVYQDTLDGFSYKVQCIAEAPWDSFVINQPKKKLKKKTPNEPKKKQKTSERIKLEQAIKAQKYLQTQILYENTQLNEILSLTTSNQLLWKENQYTKTQLFSQQIFNAKANSHKYIFVATHRRSLDKDKERSYLVAIDKKTNFS